MAEKEMKYRCDSCGKVSDKQEICCDEEMKDLSSAGCMGCQGCGMH